MPYYYQRACAVFPGTEVYLSSTSRGPHGQADAILFKSDDSGETWRKVKGLPTEVADNIDTYQVETDSSGRAWTVIDNTSLWESADFGENWRCTAAGLPYVYGFLSGSESRRSV